MKEPLDEAKRYQYHFGNAPETPKVNLGRLSVPTLNANFSPISLRMLEVVLAKALHFKMNVAQMVSLNQYTMRVSSTVSQEVDHDTVELFAHQGKLTICGIPVVIDNGVNPQEIQLWSNDGYIMYAIQGLAIPQEFV